MKKSEVLRKFVALLVAYFSIFITMAVFTNYSLIEYGLVIPASVALGLWIVSKLFK